MSEELLAQYNLTARAPGVIDSSMLKDFIDCPSMYYLRHVLGQRKKTFDVQYHGKFDWGTCWHKVLELYHKAGRDPIAGLQAIEAHYPEYLTPAVDKHNRSKERMIKQFFAYVEKWRTQDDEWEILRSEQFFQLYDEEEDFEWSGRMDNIRRNKHSKAVRVFDYKTASVMGGSYFTQHELGFQFPGYVWGADHIMTDSVCEITVDVMYTLSASFDFFRRTFRYQPAHMKEWRKNVKYWRDQLTFMLENHLHDPAAWGQNRNECTRYGPCLFLDVHSVVPTRDTRLRLLQNDYMEDRWDPSMMGE